MANNHFENNDDETGKDNMIEQIRKYRQQILEMQNDLKNERFEENPFK